MYLSHLLFLSCCASVFAESFEDEEDFVFEESDAFYTFIDYFVGDVDEEDVLEYSMEDASEYFYNFFKMFDINYDKEEEEPERYDIFKDNLEEVNKLNNQSGRTTFGITKFMDLTPEEFQQQYTGLEVDPNDLDDNPEFRINDCDYYGPGSFRGKNKPASLDYRDYDCVTPVKNQGSCSSCYAFVVAGILEIQNCLTNGILVDLAPQQIVDCDSDSNGCNRGYISKSLKNLINAGGMMKEQDYPYKAKDPKETGIGCQFDKSKSEVIPNGCSIMKPRDQSEAATMLYKKGPLGIAVPSAWGLQYYTGGILDDRVCRGPHDHAMLLIGYGKVQGEDVFIVKNSWGKNWGYNGYGLISAKLGTSSCRIMQYPMTAGSVKKIN